MLAKKIEQANKDYRKICAVVPLDVLRTKKDSEKAVKTLNAILDEAGENENHPLAELADALSLFIENFEQEHIRMPRAKPSEVLKVLMQEHGLRQSDMREIGSQGVVSEVLAGRRNLNAHQIAKLAKRFSVSPVVFL